MERQALKKDNCASHSPGLSLLSFLMEDCLIGWHEDETINENMEVVEE